MNISELIEAIKNIQTGNYEYQFTRFLDANGEEFYGLQSTEQVESYVDQIRSIPELVPLLDEFLNSPILEWLAFNGNSNFGRESKLSIENNLFKLKNSVNTVKVFLESIAKKDSENSFKIRTPEATSFEELGRVMNDFKIAFSIPVADSKEVQPLRIERVESGSFWMYVLGGSIGIQLVGGIVWAAAVVRKKHSEADFVKQQVEGYKLENNQKKILFDAQNEMLKEVIKSEALHLENQFYESPNSDPERTNRLILAIKTCQDLIDRNAQIRPSLTAPEEVSNLFPNFQNLNLIESQIKKIEEHSKN